TREDRTRLVRLVRREPEHRGVQALLGGAVQLQALGLLEVPIAQIRLAARAGGKRRGGEQRGSDERKRPRQRPSTPIQLSAIHGRSRQCMAPSQVVKGGWGSWRPACASVNRVTERQRDPGGS